MLEKSGNTPRLRLRLKHVAAGFIVGLTLICLVTFQSSFSDQTGPLPGVSAVAETADRPSRPRIAQVTMLLDEAGQNPSYIRTVEGHRNYAAQHDYPIYVLEHPLTTQQAYWSKIYWLQEIIVGELAKTPEERLEWLLWHDADTVILNSAWKLESFLPPAMPEIDFILTKDFNGLNNGVFFIKVSATAAEYLSLVAAYHHYKPDVELFWPEQVAMQLTLNETVEYHHRVVYMPQRFFDVYPGEAQPGDFLVHFAGYGDRNEAMLEWIERVENSQYERWNRGPGTEEYEDRAMEITEFWHKVNHFRSISGQLNGTFYGEHNMSANMPDSLYQAIAEFKDVCFFGTDEENMMFEALNRVEEEMEQGYHKSLPAILSYNRAWKEEILLLDDPDSNTAASRSI